jgi:hypothetical protein
MAHFTSKEMLKFTFQIILNTTKITAEANIFNDTHGMVWKGNLLVKEASNYYSTTWTGDHFVKPNNDFNLYIRNDNTRRKKAMTS